MKKLLILFVAITFVFNACKKDSNNTQKTTTLLSEIIDNTPRDSSYGKPLQVFTYKGTQLTKIVNYVYTYGSGGTASDVETHLFGYDNNGHLTGTTISHTSSSPYQYVRTTITYNGDNISDIKTYKAGNVLAQDDTLTYQNGNLTTVSSLETGYDPDVVTYTYNSAGNNTGIQDNMENSSQTFITFDTMSSLYQAFPFWVYVNNVVGPNLFSIGQPGVNNPLNSNFGGNFVYSYQYNSYGYPSAVSLNEPQYGLLSYSYQYIQVN